MLYGQLREISDEIHSQYQKSGRLLGIDLGKKTIGLAVSDGLWRLATPLDTIQRSKFSKDILPVQAAIQEYEIAGVVIGYPVNMDGSKGAGCDRAQSFADEMKSHVIVDWIGFWDERLSTVSVEGAVDEYVDKRKTRVNAKASGLIDRLAAQIILQGALDYLDQTRNA